MEQLVKRAMHKDADAFVELMQINTQSMFKVAKGILSNDEDAADAIQDTVLTCYEKLNTLREPRYFKTWMIRILINHCKDMLKRNKKHCLMEKFPDVADHCSDYARMEFETLLRTMDDKYRMILILYYVEGFRISEVSSILSMNKSTVKTRLARGRKKLEEAYGIKKAKGKGEKVYAEN